MFKFKKSAAESVIVEVKKELGELPGIIPEIKEFQLGSDVSRSERSYDLVLISGFENIEKLGRYNVHPAHQKVVKKIKEVCENIVSVDFENHA